ncbi:MAG TPA: glycosyltransferase family 9 protein, partial [Saprospiraceae bacterium]|nr:glycosyltransferase family 9 protein [Saprospiraceae bacterium]
MKVLVLRFSSIGDIVLTTPVLRGLHQQAGAEVHVLTKRAFSPILEPNPHVSRVFSFEKDVHEVLPALRAEQYDHIVDLHHNLRSLRLKLALHRPARAFDKLNLEKWLLVNTGLDLLPDAHIVHRYVAAAAHLGVRYDGQGLDHFIPPDQELHVPGLHPHLGAGGYVAFALGATHATKRLPPEQMLDICRQVPMPIVLLGGKAEQAAGQMLAQACAATPAADKLVINACGALSLHQSASVLRQSGVVLTHDTGLMHIAAALRKPIVSLWGSTVPKFGMYPLYPDGQDANTSLQVLGLRCRPCSKIGHARCPKGHFQCMRGIP